MYITSAGKRERIPMDIFIKPADWDNSKRRAKPKSENSETINLLLDQAYTKISDIRVHYRLSKMHLDTKKNHISHMQKRYSKETLTSILS